MFQSLPLPPPGFDALTIEEQIDEGKVWEEFEEEVLQELKRPRR
jgi:hypothetical protein